MDASVSPVPALRPLDAQPWVVLGCGYTGTLLARRLLTAGAEVTVTTRTAERAEALSRQLGAGAQARAVLLESPETLAGVLQAGSVLVVSVPPQPAGVELERALVAAAARCGVRRLVYLSSTGVYPAGQGGWTDEDTPVDPLGAQGAARLRSETAVLTTAALGGLPAVSLRIAAIYGPGRGVFERLRSGTYRLMGQGETLVSRIHVEDLVSAIVAAGSVEPLPRAVYCAADDEPTTARSYAAACAARLGLPPPTSAGAEAFSEAARAMLGANRRICNRRLRQELGVSLRYPTWREGLEQLIVATGR
jgi:nucleoside-diphosphate-sugar epimerase